MLLTLGKPRSRSRRGEPARAKIVASYWSIAGGLEFFELDANSASSSGDLWIGDLDDTSLRIAGGFRVTRYGMTAPDFSMTYDS
jgi:hypothetical protein